MFKQNNLSKKRTYYLYYFNILQQYYLDFV